MVIPMSGAGKIQTPTKSSPMAELLAEDEIDPVSQQEADDTEALIARLKSKVAAWQSPENESFSTQPSQLGMGNVFQTNAFEIPESEIAKRLRVPDDHVWDNMLSQLCEQSCAFFAQEVLTGDTKPPYNGRFIVSEHHEDWNQLVQNHKRLCVLAPRDHGKCQRGDALILTPEGKRVRIDEWEGGDLWAYDPRTHQLIKTYAPASRPNGVKRVLQVTTRSGRQVVVTENHPLRLWNRWERADELQVGQRIAVPLTSPTEATGKVEDAWLIGLLIGDGGFTGSNVVLSTSSLDVLNRVKKHCEVREATGYDYRLLGMQKRIRELGLSGKTAHSKRVPECIMTSDNATVAEFISGYLDADAHVNPHGGGSVEFYSVSEDLMRDVQHLLTRLGVLSVLSPKKGRYKGETHLSWRLTVRGKDIVTLQTHVIPESIRRLSLDELAQKQRDKGPCSGDCLDRFDPEVWNLLYRSENWFRENGHPRPSKKYAPTREKLRKVAIADENLELLALADAPVFWDEVTDIEALGEEETWSIHVPEYENYLADDIINHNTFFFDFAYPIWRATHQPNGNGYIFSATKEQATRILADIKEEIESNPRLQWLVPDKKENWSSTHIKLTNGHHIYARGFGTKVRGAHPDWIVVDDGLNDETAYSEVIRTKEINYFLTAITNMIVPTGQIIVVGTPFHQADLYAYLKNNPEYKFVKYQALNPTTGAALWPDRYDKERLERRKAEIGTVRFTREFQCEPISDDMSLFPGYLFRGDPTEQFTVRLGESLEFWNNVGIRNVFMGVDFAMSSNVGADYTCIFVMGTDGKANRWVMDIIREKGMPYKQQLSLIINTAKKYDPGLIYLESNQMQRIFGDELIRTTDLPVKQFVTGVQKNSLDKGVPSLRVLLENGKFRVPRGDKRSIEVTDIWIEEMRNFTWHDGKLQGVGTHDDTVMGCWICDQAIRNGAFSFDFGDGVDESSESLEDVIKELTGEDEENSGNGHASEEGERHATGNLIDDDDPHTGTTIPDALGNGWL